MRPARRARIATAIAAAAFVGVLAGAAAPASAQRDPTRLWSEYPLEQRPAQRAISFRPALTPPPAPAPEEPGLLLVGAALFMALTGSMLLVVISVQAVRGRV
jgi:hypothetical protein